MRGLGERGLGGAGPWVAPSFSLSLCLLEKERREERASSSVIFSSSLSRKRKKACSSPMTGCCGGWCKRGEEGDENSGRGDRERWREEELRSPGRDGERGFPRRSGGGQGEEEVTGLGLK